MGAAKAESRLSTSTEYIIRLQKAGAHAYFKWKYLLGIHRSLPYGNKDCSHGIRCKACFGDVGVISHVCLQQHNYFW